MLARSFEIEGLRLFTAAGLGLGVSGWQGRPY